MSALVIFGRHGYTDYDEEPERVMSWLNEPLNQDGRIHAAAMAEKLKPYNIKAIYCSDLIRAEETADIIGNYLGLPIETDFNLRPWKLDSLIGKQEKKVKPVIDRLALNEWEKLDPDDENYGEYLRRAIPTIDNHIHLAKAGNAFRPILRLEHSRNLRTVDSYLNHKIITQAEAPIPDSFGILDTEGRYRVMQSDSEA